MVEILTLHEPAMHQAAQIKGKVEYRQGDGTTFCIRPGPVEVDVTAIDATIGWADGKTRGTAAMPIADFRRYVDKGAIELEC
jgi:hypothetical protein